MRPIRLSALMFAGCLIATQAAAEAKPVLTVYTYDSFVSDWGPGPAVEKAFEADCGCDLKFVATGDGAALLARLLLEGAKTEADVVLGLDTSLTAAARASGLFAPHGGMTAPLALPVDWTNPTFLPYDWSWFAFVYDRTKIDTVPANFEALAASDLKILIEDPRSSTPGLGLLLWVKAAYGDRAAEIWKGLADNIVTVTPGWSEAYGMFLEGEADMVLSYTTSPAYHLIAESDDSKAAAPFAEGHYLQVEVAAKVKTTPNGALADRFLAFMTTDAFQSVIPETNWMYPAVTPSGGLPKGFETLIQPEKSLLFSPEEAAGLRDTALAEWQTALSR
ncbi:thiamine ABC transporter substrate binding subunit [Albidovulum sp.]|uniref:thiamine ABC transporter substrate binding subunit n=1 Tax=Albidovulum sp. TaxID=1872424 RepID=UPI0039B92BB2